MTKTYLDMHDIAEQANVQPNTIRMARKRSEANRRAGTPRPTDLPEPDIYIGKTPTRRVPGWTQKTITAWINTDRRPGRPSKN